MPDTESSPFAEPDFSALHFSHAEEAADEGFGDEDFGDEDEAVVENEFDDEEEDGEDDVGAPGDEVDDENELDERDDAGEADEAEEDDEADAGNRISGGTARSVLEHVARSIVDDPEGVRVEVTESRGGVRLSLNVAQGDMGRIIGRRGRTARALRTLVRAAAARDGQEASVDIVD